jgi:hypothetical protein
MPENCAPVRRYNLPETAPHETDSRRGSTRVWSKINLPQAKAEVETDPKSMRKNSGSKSAAHKTAPTRRVQVRAGMERG